MIAQQNQLVWPLILASGSPRRKTLMEQAGYDFQVRHPEIPEPTDLPAGSDPVATAEALAYFKARSIWGPSGDSWVLGADTLVSASGRLMGKPAGSDEARWMLRTLSAAPHEVITGVALLSPLGQSPARQILSQTTRVTFRTMSDAQIEDYIASGEWRGKAGAYAIQETADRYVEKIDGSFSNVVGLPMELLEQLLNHRCDPKQEERIS